MWPPKVQIAGVSSLDEALFCRSVGADALGFTLELPAGPHDGLTREKAARIVENLSPDILPVIITYLSAATDACRLVKEVRGKAIQFHGGIAEREIAEFRELCPDIKTIGCVTVRDRSAIETAQQFAGPLWDAIILDSYDPGTGKRGATGKTHDWSNIRSDCRGRESSGNPRRRPEPSQCYPCRSRCETLRSRRSHRTGTP